MVRKFRPEFEQVMADAGAARAAIAAVQGPAETLGASA